MTPASSASAELRNSTLAERTSCWAGNRCSWARQHGALPLAQAQVAGELEVPVVPLPGTAAAVDERDHPLEYLGAPTDDGPALAGGHVLRRLEGEGAGVPRRAGVLAAPGRAVRLGGVLEDDEVVLARQLAQAVEVGHAPADVHRDERPRPAGEGGFRRRHVHRARAGLDVHDHRDGIGRQHGPDRGHERPGGDDHLVALADVEGGEGYLERGRPVRQGRRPGACEGRPLALESPYLGSLRRPPVARVQHAQHGGTLRFVELRPGWERGGADGGATLCCKLVHDGFAPSFLVLCRLVDRLRLRVVPRAVLPGLGHAADSARPVRMRPGRGPPPRPWRRRRRGPPR